MKWRYFLEDRDCIFELFETTIKVQGPKSIRIDDVVKYQKVHIG
mgnify:CR=1 FL=1